jgi:hypothetical protein
MTAEFPVPAALYLNPHANLVTAADHACTPVLTDVTSEPG